MNNNQYGYQNHDRQPPEMNAQKAPEFVPNQPVPLFVQRIPDYAAPAQGASTQRAPAQGASNADAPAFTPNQYVPLFTPRQQYYSPAPDSYGGYAAQPAAQYPAAQQPLYETQPAGQMRYDSMDTPKTLAESDYIDQSGEESWNQAELISSAEAEFSPLEEASAASQAQYVQQPQYDTQAADDYSSQGINVEVLPQQETQPVSQPLYVQQPQYETQAADYSSQGINVEVLPQQETQPVSQPMYIQQPQYEAQAAQPIYIQQQPQYIDQQGAAPVVYAAQPIYVSQPVIAEQPPARQLNCRRALWKYIVFGILTFGIYDLVFFSGISSDINLVASRYDGRKTMHFCLLFFLIGSLTLGIGYLVWFHKISNRMKNELIRRGINYKFGAGSFWLWNVLGLLFIAGPFIYIHKIAKASNLLAKDYNVRG